MSKVIALIVGAGAMYCSMIGSYDGAVAILVIYAVVLDPFELQHKKDTTAGDSRVQNK